MACASFATTAFAQQKAGIYSVSVGQQYIAVDAGATAIVAPELQPPSMGLFTVSAVSTNGTNSTLTLTGTPPLDAYGAPVLANQYNQGASYPIFYALVTSGALTGNYYSVVSNTTGNLVINNKGETITGLGVKAIDLRPYWTLETLFPASVVGASFIATTSPSSVMTKLILSPTTVTGLQNPQDAGDAFYFDSSLKNWVKASAPAEVAGATPVPPGRYLYMQNTGNNTFPIDSYIAGTVLKTPFNFKLTGSPTEAVTTLFALPRASSYKLSEVGFNDNNFIPARIGLANDILVIDDSQGGVAGKYYRSGNKWYAIGSTIAVDPLIPSGTAYGVIKVMDYFGNKTFTNKNNK